MPRFDSCCMFWGKFVKRKLGLLCREDGCCGMEMRMEMEMEMGMEIANWQNPILAVFFI